MKIGRFNFIFPLAILIISLVALSTKIYNLPPLGLFVNPFVGAPYVSEPYKIQDLKRAEKIIGPVDSISIYLDKG